MGGYLTFVNADDSLPSTALDDLYSVASNRYDIIIARYDNGKYTVGELSCEEYRKEAITGKIISSCPFAKLFKVSLFDDYTLDIPRTIVKGEDMLMNIRLAFANNKPVCLLNKKVYNYDASIVGSCLHTFKNTMEYEQLFDKYRILSIPPMLLTNYQLQLTEIGIAGIFGVARSQKRNVWHGSPYYGTLVAKAHDCQYRPRRFVRMVLNTRNSIVIKLLFLFKAVLDKLKQLVKL